MTEPLTSQTEHPQSNDTPTITRRSCLTGLTSAAALLAGCLSTDADGQLPSADDNSSDGTNPDDGGKHGGITADDVPEFTVDKSAQPTPMVLKAVSLVDPDSITFLDEFALEIAVGNVGGAAMSNSSIDVSLEYTDGPDNPFMETLTEPDPVSVDLPPLEPGEWDTVEVDLRVNAEGDWVLGTDAKEHPAFDYRISVDPKRLKPDESVTSDVGHFEITALNPRYERTLQYETEEGGVGLFSQAATGLVAADDGEILVVHRFAIENTSDDRSIGFGSVFADNHFTNATVKAAPGDLITGDDMRDSLNTLLIPDGGEPFGSNTVDPGEKVELVAIQRVAENGIADASLTLSLTGYSDDIVFESSDTDPLLSAFELVNAEIDDTGGNDPIIELTVENVGDASGVFRGSGQFHATRPTASDWVYLPKGVEAALDPGEQATLEIIASRGDEKFRILPFETVVER